eukprot:28478-Alexandrium_andersonii.AAC.1
MKHLDIGKTGCPWCDHPEEDAMHLLWDCPRFDEVRQHVASQIVQCASCLPSSLRACAVPPSMAVGTSPATHW